MNFAAIVGVSLRSGYALPSRHPNNGIVTEPAAVPLIEGETLFR
jgi:hypothetical protein